MNTKQILRNLRYIVLGTVVAIGVSYIAQAAGTWNNAPASQATNTETPLNVSATAQIKAGGLSVNAFTANQNAQFDINTYFNGSLHAPSANGTISVGGWDGGAEHNVGMLVSGSFSNTGSIAAAPLANTTNSTVCSDANGTVVLCGGGGGAPATKEFLATGTSSASYTGFNIGTTCAHGGQDYFYSLGSGGTCGSYAENPGNYGNFTNGLNSYGHLVQVPINHVIKNTIPGFAAQGGGIINLNNASQLPPPTWQVSETATYAINLSATVQMEARILDGNFFLASGFFMRVVNAAGTAEAWYPLINDPSYSGINAPLIGYSGDSAYCPNGKVRDVAVGQYYIEIGASSPNAFYIGNPDIQYAIMGTCKSGPTHYKSGNWDQKVAFGISLNKTIGLTAGDKVYLYGKLGGAGFKEHSTGGEADGRDVDLYVIQDSSFHVVQQ